MKTPFMLTMLLCLAAVAANASSTQQALNCKLNYVTNAQSTEPEQNTYTLSSQTALIDKSSEAALINSTVANATFVAKYVQGNLEMHIKELDTQHEALSVGPLSAGQTSDVYLVTTGRYNNEELTQIELSCSVK